MRNEAVDILVTSYYRKDFTEKCLLAISNYTTYPHRIIVGDNGSNLETTDMLEDYFEVGVIDELVLLSENRGLEPMKNILLSHVQSEYFVDTDNDIIAPDGEWLTRLIKLMDERKDYAAIACTPQVFIGAI